MTDEVVYTQDGTRVVPAATEVVQPAAGVVQPAPSVVQTTPGMVVEQVPATSRTIVNNDDPVANAYAASQLIQTIVWSVVVLVLLVVALWALHVYAHLF